MSQPRRKCKPSEVIGLNSPGSVSLDVSCLRVSPSGIRLLLLGSPKLPSPPSTLLSTAGLCSWVASIALYPRLAYPGTCSESDLPKPWSELYRSWSSPDSSSSGQAVGHGSQLAPLCSCLCNSSVLDGCCKVLQHSSKEHQQQNLMLLWSYTSGRRGIVLLVLRFLEDWSSMMNDILKQNLPLQATWSTRPPQKLGYPHL